MHSAHFTPSGFSYHSPFGFIRFGLLTFWLSANAPNVQIKLLLPTRKEILQAVRDQVAQWTFLPFMFLSYCISSGGNQIEYFTLFKSWEHYLFLLPECRYLIQMIHIFICLRPILPPCFMQFAHR